MSVPWDLDLIDDPVALCDPSYTIVEANRAFRRWFPAGTPESSLFAAVAGLREELVRKRVERKGAFATAAADVKLAGSRPIPVEVSLRKSDAGILVHVRDDSRVREKEALLKIYTTSLEEKRAELEAVNRALAAEKAKVEELLLNILPREIAERIKDGEKLIADRFEDVSVLFIDIVGFTQLAREMQPRQLVELLNDFFTIVDLLVGEHHLEKIKTIGDAYMIVSGVPRQRDDHAVAIADLALAIRAAIEEFNAVRGSDFQVRAGINSGPTVAGIIGVKKFAYDLWGDTVNLASRMESSGDPGQIQVTEATRALLEDEFILSPRGIVQVKGIGEIETYWLEGRRPPASARHEE